MMNIQIDLVISMLHYTLVCFVEVVVLHSRVHILDFSKTVDVPFYELLSYEPVCNSNNVIVV